MSEYIIETKNLTKIFGKKKAVNAVNMHVKEGEIYGFIGRNGAGKTTFLKMIANLLHVSSGEIYVFGSKDLNSARNKMGILIENPGLYPMMNAYDNLKLKCVLLGIKNSETKINELLELVGLEKVANKKAKNFSLGMKQRLGLAIALINDPKVLLLDEPINGLDPQGIVEMREILLRLQKQGMTIIISSHILEELSKFANRYGVISAGHLVKELTNDELEQMSNTSIEIVVDDVAKTKKVLLQNNISDYTVENNTISVLDSSIDIALLNRNLNNQEILVSSIHMKHSSVEDMFIEMMGGANYV